MSYFSISMIMQIIIGFLSLVWITTLYQMGYVVACLLLRVDISEVSIGTGKQLGRFALGRTDFIVRAIPFGSFSKVSEAKGFRGLFLVIAGPLILVVFCFFLTAAMMAIGAMQSTENGSVVEKYHGTELRPGDRIVKVDDTEIKLAIDVHRAFSKRKGASHSILAIRGDTAMTVTIASLGGKEDRFGLSVRSEERVIPFSPANLFFLFVRKLSSYSSHLPKKLYGIVSGKVQQACLHGLRFTANNYLELLFFLSISLALLNMLPIPGSVGGNFIYGLLDVFFRLRLDERVKLLMMRISFSALFLAFLAVTFKGILEYDNVSSTKTESAYCEETLVDFQVVLDL